MKKATHFSTQTRRFSPMFGEIQVVTVEGEAARPQGSLMITENGSYDVANYAVANVTVPDTIPEGYLKPEGVMTVNTNGSYDVRSYAEILVNIASEAIEDYLGEITIA